MTPGTTLWAAARRRSPAAPHLDPSQILDQVSEEASEGFVDPALAIAEQGEAFAAIASAKIGLLTPEAGLEDAGPGLREVCEAVGMPPVLHMGSCVDNSRILEAATEVALNSDSRGVRPASTIRMNSMCSK